MKQRHCLLVAFFLIINVQESSSQTVDSIKVFFIGDGPVGEKYWLTLDGKEVLKFRSKGAFKYSFLIPDKKYGTLTGINLFRRGRFGLCRRFIELNIHHVQGFKYLVLVRDERVKNRYAVQHQWVNEEPYVNHLIQR